MFSVNQNRQLYVVKAVKNGPLKVSGEGALTPGDCHFGEDVQGNFFFQYINAKGEAIRTDLVNNCKINYVRRTNAQDMIPFVNKYTVDVNTNLITNNNVPAGKHYILRLNFSKMVGISDEDTGMVFGDYYTETATAATDLLKRLAISLAKNIAADKTQTKLATIKIGSTVITAATKFADLEEVTGNLTITEMAQAWSRGKRQFAILPFTVSGNKVTIDGVDVAWLATENGVVPSVTEKALTNNGKLVADLEWFCAGEKGDQYRGIGWPYNIDTDYLVDADTDYDLIDISYYYSGDNEDIQHSSKVLTLACLTSLTSSIVTAINGVMGPVMEEGVSND